jgi:hypothetical protein
VTSLVGLPDLREDLVSVHRPLPFTTPQRARRNRPASFCRLLLVADEES